MKESASCTCSGVHCLLFMELVSIWALLRSLIWRLGEGEGWGAGGREAWGGGWETEGGGWGFWGEFTSLLWKVCGCVSAFF